jgi:hypothetical protein
MGIENLLVKTGQCHILSRFLVTTRKVTPLPIDFDEKFVVLGRRGKIPLFFSSI